MMQVGWLKNRKLLVGASIGAIAVVAVVIYQNVHHPGWAGFGSDSTRTVERDNTGKIIKAIEVEQSGKTLWDWLSLLGVPLSLAVLGFWLQQQQQKRADEQTKLEREIAESNQQEEILQAYFDRLSALLVDKNLLAIAAKNVSPEGRWTSGAAEEKELLDASVDVIRARTLSILRRLKDSGERKGSVIRFLFESDIISKLNLSLRGADLRNVDLCGAHLCGINLSGANLGNANLSGADLSYADLRVVTLRGANLMLTNLSNANLNSANLGSADLMLTNLSNANLSKTYLRDADLSSAKNWTEDQLSEARFCKTKLPEGCKLNPSRNCDEWQLDTLIE